MGDAGAFTTDQGLNRMMGTVMEGVGLQSDTLQGNAALAQSQTRMLGSEAQTAYNQSSALGSVVGMGLGMGAGYVLPEVQLMEYNELLALLNPRHRTQ